MTLLTLKELNSMPFEDCCTTLQKCCTSSDWIVDLANKRPFLSMEDLLNKSDLVWGHVEFDGWIEATEGHPKIGDINSLAEKYSNTKEVAGGEQSGMDSASMEVIEKLADLNRKYEEKFGYIFIVCATGKSAEEMLQILEGRINNSKETELSIAMDEQNKITRLRINKLLTE